MPMARQNNLLKKKQGNHLLGKFTITGIARRKKEETEMEKGANNAPTAILK